jgi:hypothetical protein
MRSPSFNIDLHAQRAWSARATSSGGTRTRWRTQPTPRRSWCPASSEASTNPKIPASGPLICGHTSSLLLQCEVRWCLHVSCTHLASLSCYHCPVKSMSACLVLAPFSCITMAAHILTMDAYVAAGTQQRSLWGPCPRCMTASCPASRWAWATLRTSSARCVLSCPMAPFFGCPVTCMTHCPVLVLYMECVQKCCAVHALPSSLLARGRGCHSLRTAMLGKCLVCMHAFDLTAFLMVFPFRCEGAPAQLSLV